MILQSTDTPVPVHSALSPRNVLTCLAILMLMAVPMLLPHLQLLITLAMAKGLAVVGITVILRAGQVSFGHALFFGISAYAGAFLVTAMPGADLVLVLLSGYVLSAALCGLGGSLMGMTQGVVTPEYVWWVRSAEMVFIAVLGGAGSVRGAFIGALIYEMVRIYASAFAADIWQMLLGAFLLVIILFAPGGIMGIFDRLIGRKPGGRT